MRVIFDFDGTLCDITHRTHLVRREKPDWNAFYRACVDDKPVWPVIETYLSFEVINDWAAEYGRPTQNHIEIWSGRSEIVRAESENWLQRHKISGFVLKMRPEDDYTPDDDLKQQWLDEYVAKYDAKPDIVFDDRKKVVDMWRSNGIVCAQVQQWDE